MLEEIQLTTVLPELDTRLCHRDRDDFAGSETMKELTERFV
jgi:hypothetical protein